jgi:hypothetical protein
MSAVEPVAKPDAGLAQRQDELRGVIEEMLWGCAIHANVGRDYVELRDDCGLEYAIRNIVARIKIARDVMAMLKKTRAEIADGR